jgi:ssDNA-binding replication factor A large subunit
VIKARVTNKSAIKTWDKGPSNNGKLMSVDLCDEGNSEIRAVFFKATVDKLKDLFQIGHIYLISNGKIKNGTLIFNKY